MSDPVPVFGAQLTPHEILAKARGVTFRGYARRRHGEKRRKTRRDDVAIAHELGGLFIDRLYRSGEDLRDDGISEGARMLAQSGDGE